MSKWKPKIGDRVRVYGHAARDWRPVVGEVVSCDHPPKDNSGMNLAVRIEGVTTFCHPKQCRRLVKRTRQIVWVGLKRFCFVTHSEELLEARTIKPSINENTADNKPWREFIEVRRKP